MKASFNRGLHKGFVYRDCHKGVPLTEIAIKDYPLRGSPQRLTFIDFYHKGFSLIKIVTKASFNRNHHKDLSFNRFAIKAYLFRVLPQRLLFIGVLDDKDLPRLTLS